MKGICDRECVPKTCPEAPCQMTANAPYSLKLRRQTWFIRHYVSVGLQAQGMPAEVTRSLGTRDKREAQLKAPAVAVQIQAELGMMRRTFPAADVRSVEDEAERLRKAIDARVITEREAQDMCPAGLVLDMAVEAHLSTYRGQLDPRTGHPLDMPTSAVETIQRAYRRVADKNYRPLGEWIGEYLGQKGSGPDPLAAVNAGTDLWRGGGRTGAGACHQASGEPAQGHCAATEHATAGMVAVGLQVVVVGLLGPCVPVEK